MLGKGHPGCFYILVLVKGGRGALIHLKARLSQPRKESMARVPLRRLAEDQGVILAREKALRLYTDSSSEGLGAVLTRVQEDGGEGDRLCLREEEQDQWPEWLPALLLMYNNSVHYCPGPMSSSGSCNLGPWRMRSGRDEVVLERTIHPNLCPVLEGITASSASAPKKTFSFPQPGGGLWCELWWPWVWDRCQQPAEEVIPVVFHVEPKGEPPSFVRQEDGPKAGTSPSVIWDD
ncbi:hypothetical protein AAFF_G00069360 [Aldrovandia affinis]|uniref:Uncharacterized protein n=1 Tax=Aldrovandia affinis TaxID=143900 RepID=A0AAD7RZ28_9TELE|nr:hypothetical protein AAFF_G00069360 [Aldrovandia affinis]